MPAPIPGSMLILDDWLALARFCRKLRADAGLSQKELADAMSTPAVAVSVQEVSNAESGKQPSRQAMRRRIVAHFGYAVSDTFTVEPVSRD